MREDSDMKNIVLVSAALSAAAGMASAADFNARWDSISRTGYVVTVSGFGSSAAGYMNHTYNASSPRPGIGQFENANFSTFCIEIQGVQGGFRDFDIVQIDDAPNPGSSYGTARADLVHAAIKAAINLGWINKDLSLNTGTNAQIAAIQAAIWSAVSSTSPGAVSFSDDSSVAGSADITEADNAYSLLLSTAAGFAPGTRVSGLRAMVNSGSQDMLYVVPLPPAAFAGLATLVGVAGVARLRRR